MKKLNLLSIAALLVLSSMVSSCEAIAGIFKAGMGFGIFIVIAVVAAILYFVFKSGKSKT